MNEHKRPLLQTNSTETKKIDFCNVEPFDVTFKNEVKEVENGIYIIHYSEDWNVTKSGEKVKLDEYVLITPTKTTLIYQDGNVGLIGNCKSGPEYGLNKSIK